MGLLDSVIGALGGGQGGQQGGGGQAALIAALIGLLTQQQGQSAGLGASGGGLGALLEQLQRGGLGDAVGSWISSGQNQPVSGGQLESALGPDILGQLAQQFGLQPGDLGDQLSQALPQLVDRATPEGRVPDGGFGDFGDLLGKLAPR